MKQILENLLICPHCGQPLFRQDRSLLCQNRHCYDISRTGTINFLNHPVHNDYGKAMLESRGAVIADGFFTPLLSKIASVFRPAFPQGGVLLDAGCGQGSHLTTLLSLLGEHFSGIGLDLSKDGIAIAAKQDQKSLWLVGDLAHIPLANAGVPVVLNILSPANYAEFRRVLQHDGMLLKVIPNQNYLRELRERLYQDLPQQEYSNSQTLELFLQEFPSAQVIPLRYAFPVPPTVLPDLLRMTPLSWNIPQEQIDKILKDGLEIVTVDFSLLVWQNNRQDSAKKI